MFYIYNFVLLLIFPFVIARLLLRSLRIPAYRQRVYERMGRIEPVGQGRIIWLHAVSVGEVLAAVPLIKQLLSKYDAYRLLVTTTTPTGSAQLMQVFSSDEIIHCYAPYDLPVFVKRFLNNVSPSALIVMETEIWPNLFTLCEARKIPIVLANARLSERSRNGYKKLASLTSKTLKTINVIAAQGQQDASRFIELGANQNQVQVTGSIKFDLHLPASLNESAEVLRREWGGDRKIWIAASTHEGEEEQVLSAYEQIIRSAPEVLLVLVPRHPDRFDRVASLCEKRGLRTVRRSLGEICQQDTQVYLADTMGELLLMYAAADIAFIGGSLVDVGGHNLLEPAALGLPVVVGPVMYNFEEITCNLLACDGAVQVRDYQTLASTVEMLLRDVKLRFQMGENALEFVEQNRGSLARLEKVISQILD